MFLQTRITPENIMVLKENEIFVFGSNEAGRHGKGAAKTALKWGAKYGNWFGHYGNTYAIPTMNKSVSHRLPLLTIKKYIECFIRYAKDNPRFTFLVTAIGTGLAGWNPREIAPLFSNAKFVDNIYLPKSFWENISHDKE